MESITGAAKRLRAALGETIASAEDLIRSCASSLATESVRAGSGSSDAVEKGGCPAAPGAPGKISVPASFGSVSSRKLKWKKPPGAPPLLSLAGLTSTKVGAVLKFSAAPGHAPLIRTPLVPTPGDLIHLAFPPAPGEPPFLSTPF